MADEPNSTGTSDHPPGGHQGVAALVRLAAVLVGPDGRIAQWNRIAEELFGHRAEAVGGRAASGLLPAVDPATGRRCDAFDTLDRLAEPAAWAGAMTVTDREERPREVLWWAYAPAEPAGRGLLALAADARPLRTAGPRLAIGERLLPYVAGAPRPGGGFPHLTAALTGPGAAPDGFAALLPKSPDERRRLLLAALAGCGLPALRMDRATLLPVLPYDVPGVRDIRVAAGISRRYPTAQQRTVQQRAAAQQRAVRRPPEAGRPAAGRTVIGLQLVPVGAADQSSGVPGQGSGAADQGSGVPGPRPAETPVSTAPDTAPQTTARPPAGTQAQPRPPAGTTPGGPAIESTANGCRPAGAGQTLRAPQAPPGHVPDRPAPPAAGVEVLTAGSADEQLALLSEVGSRVGTTLDLDTTARELCQVLVSRVADFACVDLLDGLISDSELSEDRPDDRTMLRRVAVTFNAVQGEWDHVLPEGALLAMPRSTPPGLALQENQPVLVPMIDADVAVDYAVSLGGPELIPVVVGRSMLVLPLSARGTVLGILKLLRLSDRAPFGKEDAATLRELAARAALSLDNARLHRAEARVATTLQRSMIPTRPPKIPGVQIAHRYMPGDRKAEVGGDWFDAIQLPGSRVALVVGDVMGHGLHSAAAMGRFRTAMQTLAALDLPPGQLLRHLDNLAHKLGDDHLATCLYAVYDPINRTCELASAGHVPPVLVHPDGSGELLEIPAGAPIGVGGVPFVAKTIDVSDGSMLVLCTDGLVEVRGGDIGAGLAALCGNLIDPRRSPEEACDVVLDRLHSDDRKDDVALLVARFDGVPTSEVATWSLRVEAAEVRRARALVRRQLAGWGLTALTDTVELLVSELVTNALRVARSEVQLQLIRTDKLLVEVSDDNHNLPSLEPSEELDDGGRGLHLVSKLTEKWGTSRKAVGKVVYFELSLPKR